MATLNVGTWEPSGGMTARLGAAMLAVAATVCAVVLLCLMVVSVQHLSRHHPVGTPAPGAGPVAVRPL